MSFALSIAVPAPAAIRRSSRAPGWLGLLLAIVCAALHAADADPLLTAARKHGVRALAGVMALRPVLALALDVEEPQRLILINDFYNRRIAYAEDIDVWGQLDYWASPLELLDKGRGDCEDYALAKYFTLRAAGVPVTRLRLVYVRATQAGVVRAHMVLAYYETPKADPMILDNLVAEIRPASRRPDLLPVFSFNGEGLWGSADESLGDPVQRLSRWRDVAAKARDEGFMP